jgi:hypothetical protein
LAEHPDLVAAARAELAGRDLACWCPADHPCHADVLLDIANGTATTRPADSDTEAQLRDRAWRHVQDAAGPVTAAGIAKATRITSGAALRFLTGWTAEGRLMAGNPPAGRHAPGHVPYLPAGAGWYRVLVTGSRAWTDTQTLTSALDDLRHVRPADLLIVHGACPQGADAIADQWARRWSVTVERHPADWARLGRRAGMDRNTAMVNSGPALCLAFIRDHSPGATHCAAAAEAAGIPTIRHDATTEASPTMTAEDSPLLAAALDYAARGWHVFPLRPGDKRPAFPDHPADRCDRADPRCRDGHTGWEQRATTDPGRIRRAWTNRPYGIGVACGPSGLLVLDLDVPKPDTVGTPVDWWTQPGVNDGADVFALLCERAGQPYPAETYTVRTGRGGTHLYYRRPATDPPLRNTVGTLGWLIDTRAAGGYVVAPPTAVAGNGYRTVLDIEPAPLPGWLTDRLTPAPLPAQAPVTVDLPADRASAFLAAALDGEVARITASEPDKHNIAVYRASVALGQLVAGGALPEQAVVDTLTQAALSVGQSERETARTIASGLRAGANRPRTVAA